MRSPSPPALRTAIFQTCPTSSELGWGGIVDDLRRRDLVEELGTVAEAEPACLMGFGRSPWAAAEDCVDLDRTDRKLSPGPLSVLGIRRQHHGRETVDGLVGLLERFVERRDGLDSSDGPEGLLVDHRHPRTYTRQHCRRIEEPRPTRHLAAAQKFGPSLDGLRDVAVDQVALAFVDEGAHLRALLQTVADAERSRAGGELPQELVDDRFIDVYALDGGTDLAGIRERSGRRFVRRPRGIYAFVHDHRILTAELDDSLLELAA